VGWEIFIIMKFRLTQILASVAIALAGGSMASASIILSDSYESYASANDITGAGTSGNYTVVNDGSPNGTVNFGFNYVAAGIPLAPRSAPGTTNGLRFTANDSAVVEDAWTAFHNTSVSGSYKLTVDVWMNYGIASGSTEHAHVGVGGNGTTFNSVFTPVSGSGAFIAFTPDGGSGSDYRWFRDAANTPVGDLSSTTLPNSHPSYLGRGSNNTGAFFSSLFPRRPGVGPDGLNPLDVVGSPGNRWTTVGITVLDDSKTISFEFDGIETFRGTYAGNFDGLASLGLADTFTSVDAGTVFTLYDNLTVVAVPEPSTFALLAPVAAGAWMIRRRRAAKVA
jgi:hypothetical protein